MKHILIPTDFTLQSLSAVEAAVAKYGSERLKITLFHLVMMPAAIPDLLFRSVRNKQADRIPDEFHDGCQVLQNRYHSRIHSINAKFATGSTVAYLRNFLEGEQVSTVLICPDLNYLLPFKDSIYPEPLLKKTGYPIEYIMVSKLKKKHTDINAINMGRTNEMKIPKTDDYVIEK